MLQPSLLDLQSLWKKLSIFTLPISIPNYVHIFFVVMCRADCDIGGVTYGEGEQTCTCFSDGSFTCVAKRNSGPKVCTINGVKYPVGRIELGNGAYCHCEPDGGFRCVAKREADDN